MLARKLELAADFELGLDPMLNAKAFVHQRAGCCVLQQRRDVRKNDASSCKRGHGAFVKAAMNQLFLPRIGADIAHGENTFLAGFASSWIDFDLMPLNV
jgi:hypothetical protein